MMHRPPVVRDGDRIVFRVTRPSEARIAATFVDALNEGTLFDRPMRVFQDAAKARQLFHVINSTTDTLIGTAIVQEAPPDAAGHRASAEVGGMMVHPGARHFGIATLLLQVVMVHELRHRRHDRGEAFIAHVIDGNEAPVHALRSAGFACAGPVVVHPGEVDADVSHMIPAGAAGVPMHGYRLEPEAFDHLIRGLWQFVHDERCLVGDEVHGHAEVDFSALVDPDWLEREVAQLRARGRLPPG